LLVFKSDIDLGAYQNGSLTNNRLYNMCQIFLEFTPQNASWRIFFLNTNGSTGHQLANNAMNVAPGNYVVLGPGMFCFDLIRDNPLMKRQMVLLSMCSLHMTLFRGASYPEQGALA
jgi:hypothetical protein